MQPSDLPGWLGTARVDRSVEKPGIPGRVAVRVVNVPREDITEEWPWRETERPVVAKKPRNGGGAKGPY
jgi:hypothetical protein